MVIVVTGQMYVVQATLHLVDHPVSQRDDDVKAAQHRFSGLALIAAARCDTALRQCDPSSCPT